MKLVISEEYELKNDLGAVKAIAKAMSGLRSNKLILMRTAMKGFHFTIIQGLN